MGASHLKSGIAHTMDVSNNMRVQALLRLPCPVVGAGSVRAPRTGGAMTTMLRQVVISVQPGPESKRFHEGAVALMPWSGAGKINLRDSHILGRWRVLEDGKRLPARSDVWLVWLMVLRWHCGCELGVQVFPQVDSLEIVPHDGAIGEAGTRAA